LKKWVERKNRKSLLTGGKPTNREDVQKSVRQSSAVEESFMLSESMSTHEITKAASLPLQNIVDGD